MKRCIFAVVALLLAGVPSLKSQGADVALYTVENLGNFGGQVPSITGINASGQMSGVVNGTHAVRYTPGIGWEDFPALAGFAIATGINSAGDLVGYRSTPAGLRAFRYRDGAGVQDIEPLPGGTMTFGYAINAAGDVVGGSDTTGGVFRAFRATPSLPAVELPALGGDFAFACGINDAGQIVGQATTASGIGHAFRIDPGQPTPVQITSFDGAAGASIACAIDADGRVGGQADQTAVPRAFRFFGGSLLLLDTFGSTLSNTESIAGGTSVGWYTRADGASRAFVHTDADGSADLNTRLDGGAGWVLSQARGINASGVIVGDGTFNGAPAAFRLTPVPMALDTTAPVITALTANPSSIFPPNGAMVAVAISVSATDDTDPSPVCSVTGINGHGAPAGDSSVTAPLAGSVRATGGATYSFLVSCSDASGNAATGSVDVVVPPDTTAPVISSVTASPSTIWPPTGALVTVAVNVSATDNADAAPACALSSITSTGVTTDDYSITGPFSARLRATGGRTYTLNVRCADAAGNSSYGSTQVQVPPDTTAPTITALSATPGEIWPPNGKFVPVSVSVSATDNVDASPSCALTSITGVPATYYMVTGALSASVRAEKGAVYELHVSCSDGAGNRAQAVTLVVVTKDPPVAASAKGPKNGKN
jgi:probable HAF family extracellular repeat protein